MEEALAEGSVRRRLMLAGERRHEVEEGACGDAR
jgi:hypothetical protein